MTIDDHLNRSISCVDCIHAGSSLLAVNGHSYATTTRRWSSIVDLSNLDVRTEEEKANNVPPVTIRLEEFGSSGLEFVFFMVSADLADSYNGASRIRDTLLKEFKEHGISIPYQTVDVNIRNE